MSIADLKTRLANVPGIETLTLTMIGGRHVYGFAGLIAAVDPLATDQEIDDTIRRAARLIPDKPKGNPMSVTGAGFLGGSIKAKIQAAKDKIAAGHSALDQAVTKLDGAAEQSANLAKSISDEADALLADIGQFTNGAPE